MTTDRDVLIREQVRQMLLSGQQHTDGSITLTWDAVYPWLRHTDYCLSNRTCDGTCQENEDV